MPIEWLPLTLPCALELNGPAPSEVPVDTIEVSRTANLNLTANGTSPNSSLPLDRKRPPAGALAEAIESTCVTSDGKAATLRWYGPMHVRHTWKAEDDGHGTVLSSGSALRLDVRLRDGLPTHVIEWLANVDHRGLWPEVTQRDHRTGLRVRGKFTAENPTSTAFSSDHIRLALDLPQLSEVIFGKVDERDVGVPIPEIKPGFLEFWPGPEGFPDDTLRNSVRRALEFLLGCGLGVLGSSEVDDAGRALNATVLSSTITGGSDPPLRPGLLHSATLDELDPKLMSNFIVQYLALEQTFRLNQVVWLFLHGRNAPLDMKAGYVGASLEILRRGYYALPANKARSLHLPRVQWRALRRTLESVVPIPSDPSDGPNGELTAGLLAVMHGIGGLNRVSGTKLNERLLEDLELDFGQVELKALAARNDAAHANPLDPATPQVPLARYRALHTLLARVFLSLVGGPVRYFDYSTIEHPCRFLREAQGPRPTQK